MDEVSEGKPSQSSSFEEPNAKCYYEYNAILICGLANHGSDSAFGRLKLNRD